MPADLRPGPDSPPTDELAGAEAALSVLAHVLHTIVIDDMSRQTPCQDYDLTQLTYHLLNSTMTLGVMVGVDYSADYSTPDYTDPVEGPVVTAARKALDAWHRRGLEGTIVWEDNEMPAKVAASVFSVEFLVHAWDYAAAVGHEMAAPDPLVEYVHALAQQLIPSGQRGHAGFADAIDVSDDASSLHRLIAFTGRDPAWQGRLDPF